MPKTSVYVNGKSLSVDNHTFNVEFNKSISDLKSGLYKAQKPLGLFYNHNQQINDVMGRCVEGLSMWQIRLGMWVDETGKARTVAGEYADSLSRTELELGFYADKLGNVYKRTGACFGEPQTQPVSSEAGIKLEKRSFSFGKSRFLLSLLCSITV